MAELVERALGENKLAVIEAGTGTGKDNLAPPPSLAKEVENVFTDANGNVERTETDALSARVKHTDAVGRLTVNERDADALPTLTTRPNASRRVCATC